MIELLELIGIMASKKEDNLVEVWMVIKREINIDNKMILDVTIFMDSGKNVNNNNSKRDLIVEVASEEDIIIIKVVIETILEVDITTREETINLEITKTDIKRPTTNSKMNK